jgi:hypothetical protein
VHVAIMHLMTRNFLVTLKGVAVMYYWPLLLYDQQLLLLVGEGGCTQAPGTCTVATQIRGPRTGPRLDNRGAAHKVRVYQGKDQLSAPPLWL